MARKTSAVSGGDTGLTTQYNFLRDETQGSARLLAQGTSTLKVFVNDGLVYFGDDVIDFTGSESALMSNTAASSRIDAVSLQSSNSLIVTVGTEDDSPTAPSFPEDDIPICTVYIRNNAENIDDTDGGGSDGYIDKDFRPFISKRKLKSIIYTDVTIDAGGTPDEEDLISVTILGGTLGTNGGIRIRLFIDQFYRGSGFANKGKFRLKYGGTTIITGNDITPTQATDNNGYVDILLLATGATNSQEASMGVSIEKEDVIQTNKSAMTQHKIGTASEDSTADKTLVITFQWFSAQGASDYMRMAHGIVETI